MTGIIGWADEPMVAFDLETTGTDPLEARIVTACVVRVNDGEPAPARWLVDPGVEIPAEATAVHGVTTERARAEGIAADVACADIAHTLRCFWDAGVPVVIYNASYDLTVLDQELARHGHGGIGHVGPVIDPLVIDRSVDKYRKGRRTLTAACEQYDVRHDGAHDSTADALAAARVAWRIARRYPHVAAMTLDELMDAQQKAHAEWADHLTAYFRSRDGATAEVVDPSWPLRHRSGVAA